MADGTFSSPQDQSRTIGLRQGRDKATVSAINRSKFELRTHGFVRKAVKTWPVLWQDVDMEQLTCVLPMSAKHRSNPVPLAIARPGRFRHAQRPRPLPRGLYGEAGLPGPRLCPPSPPTSGVRVSSQPTGSIFISPAISTASVPAAAWKPRRRAIWSCCGSRAACPRRSQGTTKEHRVTAGRPHRAGVARVAARRAAHPEKTAARQEIVELVFETLLLWHHDQFLPRGWDPVRVEFSLSAVVDHLRRGVERGEND